MHRKVQYGRVMASSREKPARESFQCKTIAQAFHSREDVYKFGGSMLEEQYQILGKPQGFMPPRTQTEQVKPPDELHASPAAPKPSGLLREDSRSTVRETSRMKKAGGRRFPGDCNSVIGAVPWIPRTVQYLHSLL
jgi:hypothetical protein